jgi:hypothetical protein
VRSLFRDIPASCIQRVSGRLPLVSEINVVGDDILLDSLYFPNCDKILLSVPDDLSTSHGNADRRIQGIFGRPSQIIVCQIPLKTLKGIDHGVDAVWCGDATIYLSSLFHDVSKSGQSG